MPSWTRKDERQYEHIKASERKRGRTLRRAKQVAGATVNKQRRLRGETPNRTTQGTGNPFSTLEERSVRELRNLAARKRIRGRSRMKKRELIAALRS